MEEDIPEQSKNQSKMLLCFALFLFFLNVGTR